MEQLREIEDIKVVPYQYVTEEFIKSIKKAKRPRGNHRSRYGKKTYRDITTAFDIETTRLDYIDQSIMYIWQMSFENEFCVVGRYWFEFKALVANLKNWLNGDRLVCYVHNLSYEFQFLSGIFEFSEDDVFCTEPRKILYCTLEDTIEFRCSYKLTNMTLAKFTEQMEVKHQKQPEIDYDEKRYPWTELTDEVMKYSVWDVVGLSESVRERLNRDGDTLYTIPLTSTGYVRREAKRRMKNWSYKSLQRTLPPYKVFKVIEEAVRGGDTHANRYRVGEIVEDVHGVDASSMHPSCMLFFRFPMGEWKIERLRSRLNIEYLVKNIYRKKAFVARMAFKNLRLKVATWPVPYLAKAKCRNIEKGVYDNGRILSADYLEVSIVSPDFDVIMEEYEFDGCAVLFLAHSSYGALPTPLTDLVLELYGQKTQLKGVDGYMYTRSKEKVNGVYGMTIQNPIKKRTLYQNGEFVEDETANEESLYNEQMKKAFLSYAWGVFTVAYSRRVLHDSIHYVEDQAPFSHVYSDTDSSKYIGSIDWEEFNTPLIERAEELGAYAFDSRGVKHYMQVFEHDSDYSKFATLGAKKYAYEDENGKFGVTIAGVGKAKGAKELKELGGLQAFCDSLYGEGVIFEKAGGVDAVYNDEPDIKSVEVEGHNLRITKNVCLRPSTYTLGVAQEYFNLLNSPEVFKKL